MHTAVLKLWRFIFWFWALAVGVSFVLTPFGDPSFADFLLLILGTISLAPLYGFAYQIAIGTKVIAVLIFVANLPAFFASIYYALWLIYIDPSAIQALFSTLGMAVLCSFMYPLYSYSFKCSHIWGRYA